MTNISSVSCENTGVMIGSEVGAADSAEREESSGDILLDTLKNSFFRFPAFRPSQREIIETINNGKDALVVLSAGGGKTLCFALPAAVFDGITVVIMQLISLMYNLHCHISLQSGITCKALNENTTLTELSDLYHDLCSQHPSTKVVIVTPDGRKRSELKDHLIELHQRKKLRFVIDEAHCMAESGHEYRPDYLDLVGIKQTYQNVQISCFTATTTKDTCNFILNHLTPNDCVVFKQPIRRSNLVFAVKTKSKKKRVNDERITLVSGRFSGQCGIIYCSKANDVVGLAYQVSNYKAQNPCFHVLYSTHCNKR